MTRAMISPHRSPRYDPRWPVVWNTILFESSGRGTLVQLLVQGTGSLALHEIDNAHMVFQIH